MTAGTVAAMMPTNPPTAAMPQSGVLRGDDELALVAKFQDKQT
jgi:hypothetical protein